MSITANRPFGQKLFNYWNDPESPIGRQLSPNDAWELMQIFGFWRNVDDGTRVCHMQVGDHHFSGMQITKDTDQVTISFSRWTAT